MLILTQTKMLVNIDHVVDIYVDNGDVLADLNDHSELLLGHYVNSSMCEEIIEKIGQSYGAITTFKMP